MQSPEPAGKTGPPKPRRRTRKVKEVEQIEVLETESIAPVQPRPQYAIDAPVYDFVVAFTEVAQGLRGPGMAPMSRLSVAQQVQAMSRDLRNSVQRKEPAEVIRGTIGITALCLLLFLSVTPHYQEVEQEANTNNEGGGDAGKEAEAQTDAA